MLQSTLKNRTIFCKDNLDILKGIDSNTIDLMYLDPPFNKKQEFSAPIGSSAEGAKFKDIFREEDIKDEWLQSIQEDSFEMYQFLEGIKNIGHKSNFCYLCYMAIRLVEMHRILRDTGSLYLHCDTTMNHYLKLLMDCIFGEDNCRNEITWKRTYAHNDAKRFGRNKDTILFYTKTEDYYFSPVILDYDSSYVEKNFRYKDQRGFYTTENLTGPGLNKNDQAYKGFHPKDKGRSWSIPKRVVKSLLKKEARENDKLSALEKLELLDKHDYLIFSQHGTPRFKSYLHDLEGVAAQEIWTDIKPLSSHAKERVGYPTQKPLALVERIIKASCPEGGVVLDPFCGCATTCVAAEKIARKWVGIDVSIEAYNLVKERLSKEISSDLWEQKHVSFSTEAPARTDKEDFYREEKFVYVLSHPKYPNEYKVGIAKNWEKRLNSYQTSDPDRNFKIEYRLKTQLFREIESHIHSIFENKHEWVRADLQEIISEIEKYGNHSF